MITSSSKATHTNANQLGRSSSARLLGHKENTRTRSLPRPRPHSYNPDGTHYYIPLSVTMSATVFKFFQPKGESLLACRFSWVPEWRTLGIIYSPGQFQSIGKILQRRGRISFVEHSGKRHASDYPTTSVITHIHILGHIDPARRNTPALWRQRSRDHRLTKSSCSKNARVCVPRSSAWSRLSTKMASKLRKTVYNTMTRRITRTTCG